MHSIACSLYTVSGDWIRRWKLSGQRVRITNGSGIYSALLFAFLGCAKGRRIGLWNWISECFQTDLCKCAVNIIAYYKLQCNMLCEKNSSCFNICVGA